MSSSPHAPRPNRLLGIQAARGVAAFLVFAFHFQNGLSWIVGYVPFWGLFEFGRSGVDFFFVLSGFIIFLVHADDIDRAHRLPRYAWRRLGRIYPAYWLATCVFMLLTFASGAGATLLDADWLLRSFLLAPQTRPPIVAIGWSLHHEMVFYALFAILIVRRIIGIALFVLWLAAILYTCATSPAGVGPMNFISPFDLQFFFGMAAAYIVRKGRIPTALPMAVVGVILFATAGRLEVAGIFTATNVTGRVLYGLASVLITIGIAGAEQQGTLRVPRWADIFGGMSYALYLFHIIVLVILQTTFAATGAGAYLPGWLIVGGSMAMTLATAAMIHIGFEKPMIARIYALSVRKTRGALPP